MALVTGTSDVAVDLQGFYDRNLLERALPALIYGRFAQLRPLPRNKGTRINFRRYGALAVATTPLVEGVTPTGKKLTTTDIYATVKEYGDFVMYSDLLSMVGLDGNLVEMGEVLGEQMGQTMDVLDREVLVAGTSVRYANGQSARTSVATAIATSDVKAAVRILEGGNAKKINRSVMVAGKGIGTRPIAPAFYAITHTDMRQDLEDLAGFTKVEEYASQKGVPMEEIGSWGNTRWLVTTQGKIWNDSTNHGAAVGSTGLVSSDSTYVDVYASVMLGQNAYGSVPLQRGTIRNIIKKLGSAGSGDPLDQRGSSGWKFIRATKILNDDFMTRIEAGVTDL